MFRGKKKKPTPTNEDKLYLSLFVQWLVKSVTLCENTQNWRPDSC